QWELRNICLQAARLQQLCQRQLSLRAGLEHKPIATPIDARTHRYENPPNFQPTAGDTPGPAIPRATADDSPIVRSRQPSQSDRSRIGPLSSKLGARSRPTQSPGSGQAKTLSGGAEQIARGLSFSPKVTLSTLIRFVWRARPAES